MFNIEPHWGSMVCESFHSLGRAMAQPGAIVVEASDGLLDGLNRYAKRADRTRKGCLISPFGEAGGKWDQGVACFRRGKPISSRCLR